LATIIGPIIAGAYEHARDVLPRVTRKVLAIDVKDGTKQALVEVTLTFDPVRPR